MSDVSKIPNQTSSLPPGSSVNFSLILALFFTGRLMLLLAFPPENLITYGDYRHYFNLAEMTRGGFYPFLHYWYEFPPIFPYLNILVYQMAGQQLHNYILLLAFVLLLAECGNLFLLYRLAFILYGRSRALQAAWIYTALFTPIFFWLGNFDALTTFFILLGLYGLIRNRPITLAAAVGLGAMVKILPVVLLAAVWRVKGWRAVLAYTLAVLIFALIIWGPFALANPTLTLASLQAQASKSSYQTVWALLDGNLTTGNFGPLADHFDPARATQPLHHPARIPSWLTLLPFGLLGFYLLNRPGRLPVQQDAVVFTLLTFVIFLLWSPGWSPQWQTFLIPLLLLSFAEGRAVFLIVLLSFINFLEWPVMLSRGINSLLPVTVLARTAIFVLIGVELYQKLALSKGISFLGAKKNPTLL